MHSESCLRRCELCTTVGTARWASPYVNFATAADRLRAGAPAPLQYVITAPTPEAAEALAERMAQRRRTITNTDGRLTVEGYPGTFSDRTLAEYVAAELDRVDPL